MLALTDHVWAEQRGLQPRPIILLVRRSTYTIGTNKGLPTLTPFLVPPRGHKYEAIKSICKCKWRQDIASRSLFFKGTVWPDLVRLVVVLLQRSWIGHLPLTCFKDLNFLYWIFKRSWYLIQNPSYPLILWGQLVGKSFLFWLGHFSLRTEPAKALHKPSLVWSLNIISIVLHFWWTVCQKGDLAHIKTSS